MIIKLNYKQCNPGLKYNVTLPKSSQKFIVIGKNEIVSLRYVNYILKKYSRPFKRRRRLSISTYKFRNSLLGLKVEFAGRFSRAQRKYFSYHQKGRVPFNSFIVPIRTFCLPVILKYGVSTVKIWIAYPVNMKLVNYAFLSLRYNYVLYSSKISYFVDQTWFTKPSISCYLKKKNFKISLLYFFLLEI